MLDMIEVGLIDATWPAICPAASTSDCRNCCDNPES